jgi:hypothetical protein
MSSRRAPRSATKPGTGAGLPLAAVPFPMPDRVGERPADVKIDGAAVLTDDFAPVDIYRMTPARPQKGR